MDFFIAQDGWTIAAQAVFVLSAAALLLYAILIAARPGNYTPPEPNDRFPPVSVVVAARNEQTNLQRHLPDLLAQDYPEYEVVVVNDSSRDDTSFILNELAAKYAHLRIVTIRENEKHDGGKKLAITLGVKAAKYDRLLFTDADCRPAGSSWIRAMMKRCPNENSLVLGYAPYARTKGLLNALIRTDALVTATDYFGYALAGLPYMGVGRNLSYPKSEFFRIGGFRAHYSLASGDDDLLVNQLANKLNTHVCLDREGHVESLPKTTWSEYWHQKRRHITTGRRYKRLHRVLLVARPIALALLLASCVGLAVADTWMWPVAVTLIVLFFLRMALFYRSSRWLDHRDILIFAPVMEAVVLAFTAGAHLANAFSKPKPWKK